MKYIFLQRHTNILSDEDEHEIFYDDTNIEFISNSEMQIRDNSSADEQMKETPFTNECFMRSSLNAPFSNKESFVLPFHSGSPENFEDSITLFNLNDLQKNSVC